ncbi:MAG: ABC transporter permease [Opitutales bacterium]|nr:ABC transporter permease [Opitutales bacterium]
MSIRYRHFAMRLKSIFRPNQKEEELKKEIEFHLAQSIDENIRNGMSKRQAEKEALQDFGIPESHKEECRDSWKIILITDMIRDLKLSWRQLMKSKGFFLTSILTLGIGIGACTVMFNIVNTVLLKPLPFEDPNQLVWIQNSLGRGLSSQTTKADFFVDWMEQNEGFESMGGYDAFFDYTGTILSDEQGLNKERIQVVPITETFFSTLGVRPAIGQDFKPEHFLSFDSRVVILTHDYWQKRFDGDSSVIGQTIWINDEPNTITGVMPKSFDFDSVFIPGTDIAMFYPLPLIDQLFRQGNTLAVVGRLKQDASLEAATANLKAITERTKELQNWNHQANTSMLNDRIRGPFKQPFWILVGAVFCVMAIACINIANLLVARSIGRGREFAIRSALGANRNRLIRQTLVESSLLAAIGMVMGVILAYGAMHWVKGVSAFNIPLLQTIEMDLAVLFFVLAMTGVCSIACGILPALHVSKARPGSVLSSETQKGSSGKRSSKVRNTLVILEVGLSCLLMIGAGLLIRSFSNLINQDLGFEPDNAISWRVDDGRSFETGEARAQFYDQLTENIQNIPGVNSAGYTDTLPLGRNRTWLVRTKDAIPGDEDGRRGRSNVFPRLVSKDYLETMNISLLSGRYFDSFDNENTEVVVVINERLANRLWKDQQAIGKVIQLGNTDLKVIGVVENVKHGSLDKGGTPEMYLLTRQGWRPSATDIVVRSDLEKSALIASVKQTIHAYSKTMPADDFTEIEALVSKSLAPKRLIMNILGMFSVVALFLAAVGLFGVISFSVKQRTKEIGIRIALGATRKRITSMILSEGTILSCIGIALGLFSAFLFSKLLEKLVYGIAANDLSNYAINSALVLSIGIVATLIPAIQALRNDPMSALRYE